MLVEVPVDSLWSFWLPVPVVLVSTANKVGIKNVAPYCMVMQISSRPPIIALGIAKKRKTYKNIADNGEFVVNVPTENMIKIINKTADPCEPTIDKFEAFNLTPVASLKIKAPKVGECKIHFECKLMKIEDLGGDHDLVIGRVVAITTDEEIANAKQEEIKEKMKPVFYGVRYYHALGNFLGDRNLR
jgi:flavin reductase (DIM6/NTAB) family NADH-FMN oxidoreductase RutF